MLQVWYVTFIDIHDMCTVVPAAAVTTAAAERPGLEATGRCSSQDIDDESQQQQESTALLPSQTEAVQLLLHAVTHADCTEADEQGWRAVPSSLSVLAAAFNRL